MTERWIQNPNGSIITDLGGPHNTRAPEYSYGRQYHFGFVNGPGLTKQMHPNLAPENSEFRGDNQNLIGYINTNFLSQMHGNPTEPERVRHYERKLLNGEGFQSPIRVMHHFGSGGAIVHEGNHRLQAAQNLGLSHVPTVMDRQSSEIPSKVFGVHRPVGRIAHESEEEWPFKENDGRNYITPQYHPRWVLHKDLVLPEYPD